MVRQAGLTLIEMLIALVILATVMSLSSIAYSFYVTGFINSDKKFTQNMHTLKMQLAWQEQLSAAFYYMIEIAPENNRPYFVGDKQQLQWVATTSLQQPGMPALARLDVFEKQLRYCEMPLVAFLPKDLGVLQQKICEHYSITIQAADSIEIDYFSWPDLDQRLAATESAEGGAVAYTEPMWRGEHDGLSQQLLPEWVRIKLTLQDEEQQVWIWLENNDKQRFSFYGTGQSG